MLSILRNVVVSTSCLHNAKSEREGDIHQSGSTRTIIAWRETMETSAHQTLVQGSVAAAFDGVFQNVPVVGGYVAVEDPLDGRTITLQSVVES